MEGLRTNIRLVTTHDSSGKAIFSNAVGDAPEPRPIQGGTAIFGLQYCSEEFPADLNHDKDIEVYQKFSQEPPGLTISTGTVLRTVGE